MKATRPRDFSIESILADEPQVERSSHNETFKDSPTGTTGVDVISDSRDGELGCIVHRGKSNYNSEITSVTISRKRDNDSSLYEATVTDSRTNLVRCRWESVEGNRFTHSLVERDSYEDSAEVKSETKSEEYEKRTGGKIKEGRRTPETIRKSDKLTWSQYAQRRYSLLRKTDIPEEDVPEVSPLVETECEINRASESSQESKTSCDQLGIVLENKHCCEDSVPEVMPPAVKLDWLEYTRYKPPRIPRRVIPGREKRRKPSLHPRIPFSSNQLEFLEERFREHVYLTKNEVAEIAATLRLPHSRVKIWFQNRRARARRETQRSQDST